MIVVILERVRPGLRGTLTRWLLEVRAGVFVGRVSAQVREQLWKEIRRSTSIRSGAILIHQTNNEQGFRLEVHGVPSRVIEDFEGLQLVRRLKDRDSS